MSGSKLSLTVLQSERLPCHSCGGKCCTFAPFTASELRQARLANGGSYPSGARVLSGLPIKAMFGGGSGSLVVGADGITCAFLKDGRCSIYEARPRACRDYGRVPELPCQVLHPKESRAIAERNWGQVRGVMNAGE